MKYELRIYASENIQSPEALGKFIGPSVYKRWEDTQMQESLESTGGLNPTA
jgi:predicted transcriptional regulator